MAKLLVSGADFICAERRRQQREHGYIPESDRVKYGKGELEKAAFEILHNRSGQTSLVDRAWQSKLARHVIEKYKDDPIQQLAIVGAFIAAEIDRLQLE